MRTAADKRHFWLRRIHSLTGFVPIGAYLLVHIFLENASIRFYGGGKGFNTVADFFGEDIPLYVLGSIEVVLIGSIVYHAIYGLFIAANARANVTRYGLGRNWAFLIQRVTGVITLVFIGYHLWTTRLSVYFGMLGWAPQVKVDAVWMAHNIFGNGWVTALYAIGVTSAIFHFFNGIWGGLIHWGITVGPKAQRVSAYICTLVGVAASVFGLWVLWGFQPFLTAGA